MTQKTDHCNPQQLDLFIDLQSDDPSLDEIMRDLRESAGSCMGPYFSDDLLLIQQWWQEEFNVRTMLREYFEDATPEVAHRATVEDFVEAWGQLSEEYWCPDSPMKSNCDACGRLLGTRNFLTLAGRTTVHFGGEWGAQCLTYLRLVNERERDEAIAALERMKIGTDASRSP